MWQTPLPCCAIWRQQLPSVADWSGTVGVGVAGNNVEYFDEPALSIMLCDLPPAQYRVFSGVAPLPPGARQGDDSAFAAHAALVHADGRTPDLAELLVEMAGRTSSGYLFGGVAASRGASLAFAQHAGGDGAASGVLSGGLSGVAFSDQVGLVSRVTQDCQPIGPQAVVTQAQDNVVLRLDGQPALDVLLETLGVRLNGDPQPALRAVRHTLAGLSSADAPALQGTGHFGADTRVRHIVGLDVARGGVALADRVQVGMRLAFCQRHMDAARADLTRICAEIREELAPEPPARRMRRRRRSPSGASAARCMSAAPAAAGDILAGPVPSCKPCTVRWATCPWSGSLPRAKLPRIGFMATPAC